MRPVWRITAFADLAGLGGEKSSARWHWAAGGKRIVYLAEHPALSLLEIIANLKGKPKLFPDTYKLMKLRIADGVSAAPLSLDSLPSDWPEKLEETRSLGDAWLADKQSCLLTVPSAVCPEATNYLFNPLHADAGGVSIEWSRRLRYDKRLFLAHELKASEIPY